MPIQEGGTFAPTQNIVSPGVFTRENDLSGLAQGVANIGGAIVAPFTDGPAFFPATISEVSTLESTFGVADGVYYGPYTAKEYLQQQGIVTIVRVGGLTGYWQKNPLLVYAQPGAWNRNSDIGAITDNSYISLDDTNYTTTFNYQQSSSVWNITGSIALGGNTPAGFMTASLKFSKLTGSIASSSINSFITSLGVVTNSSTLNDLLYASASKGKLFQITTRQLANRFSTSVTANGKTVGKTSGYALAPFHPELSRVSGSVSVGVGTAVYASGQIPLTFDTAWNDLGSGSINRAPIAKPAYLNYLTNSYTLVGSDINYGFVFARQTVGIGTYPTVYTASINSTGLPGSTLSSSVKIQSRYDISRLNLNGDITVQFGDISATSALTTAQLSGGDGTTLSGSQLYAGQTVQIGSITNVLFNRKNVRTTQAGATNTSLPYFFLTSSVQGQDGVDPETSISTAFAESTTTNYLFSSSYFNDQLTVNNTFFNYDSTGTVNLRSGSFASVRVTGACNSGAELNGAISGAFGKYNGSFTANDNNQAIDPCNPNIDGRQKMILSVLTNTQNASTQFSNDYEVYGFNTSTLSQLTSSTFPYKGLINPTENVYNLALKYNFTNTNGSVSAGTYGYYDFSLNENDNNYIKDVFGMDPTVGNPDKQIAGQKVEAAYNYVLFEDSIKKFVAEKTSTLGWRLFVGTSTLSGSAIVGEPLKFVDQYSTNLNAGDSQFGITNAYTPWVYSQKIAPFKGSANEAAVPTKFQLFKAHTMSDGTLSNRKYKIEISNVKLSGTVPGSDWGSFTLGVRAYSDTDKKPKYLEIFQNLNLDPDSANYIARRIGDRYAYITYAGKIIQFGTYANLSRYIRIEMADVAYPVSCIPYGFESYSTPINSTAGIYIPYVQYSKASIYGLAPGKYPSGTVFGAVPASDSEIQALYPTSSYGVGVDNNTKQYFNPLPYFGSTDSNGLNIDFDLEDKVYGTSTAKYYAQGTSASTGSLLAPSLSGSIPSVYDAVNESTYVKLRKFIVGFQGGFEGQWPAIPINVGSNITAGNTQGLDCTNINSPGSIAYKQCIASLGNADEFDINLIVTPGIFREQHSYVTELVIDMCETRQDCFYIMDNVVFPASNQTVGLIDAAINSVATIDSNYVGTYYPWVKILDTNTNKIISVPPSVVLPAVYAANDNSAAEWYAPAGLNRGGIPTAVQVLDRVTHSERDTLYEGRVNPIAAFPGQGICVWGQKTLQIAPSALDRINVRRLLINLKKFIASSSNYLVFEQNVASTRNRFLNIVNPYLESVQQRNGIYAFQVKMDAENNTPDLIDRNILYGQIYIQPTRTAEFIILDFNILPTGAQFSS
jgi:hypothetical protein